MALSEAATPSGTPIEAPDHLLAVSPGDDPVIIIGGGPAGVRAAQEVARRGLPAILFNAERWQPYNRVKLTPFLAGDVQIGQIYQPMTFPHGSNVAVDSQPGHGASFYFELPIVTQRPRTAPT